MNNVYVKRDDADDTFKIHVDVSMIDRQTSKGEKMTF